MSHRDQVLEHLKSGRGITSMEALNSYRCFRLAPRINELKKKGYEIVSEMVEDNGKRYAKYKLKNKEIKNEDNDFGANTCECGGYLQDKDFNGYKFRECFSCKKKVK